MSHEISVVNGRAEMVSARGLTPWHGLGEIVSGLLTAKDALTKAHLDWTVKGFPVTVNGKDLPFPNGESADTWMGICREDTGTCLGITKGRYTPIQNADAFDWMDALIGQGEAVYDTAGALRGGRQVWLLAKVDGNQTICGDEHRTFALLLTSHDGSYATQVSWVTERVVCANTLAVALRGAKNIVKVRHTANWQDKAEEAKRVLGIGQKYFTSIQAALESLGSHLLTAEQMAEFSTVLIPAADEKEIPTRTKNIRAEITRLFGEGQGNKGQTRYDALQAVTDYADHFATLRGQQSTRLESAILGSGAELKQRAFDMLTSDDLMAELLAKGHSVSQTATATGTDFGRLLGN